MEKLLFDELSGCPGDTEKLGARLGDYLLSEPQNPAFVALYGDLGAGKTAFVAGLASVVAPGACVSSPTYSIVNEYRGGGRVMYHFDMYRITSEDDLFSVGFYDYDGITAAEWCENIPFALPDERIDVKITGNACDTRRVTAVLRLKDGKEEADAGGTAC